MKNKLLFMMLTILGAPGIAAAAGYDLANSEYNFAVNELGNDSNLLIVFYVQIMPDDFVMQLHRF
ncbi:minor curlin subunit [Escherichia coli HVH 68 (4-0888028)]|nr:minor curlin subunit [Escherichia coli HVH 68 (4-0888028)]